MTDDVVHAIALLQARCRACQWRSSYWNERCERALDDLVRNPDRVGPPALLVANALANAGKCQRRRGRIARLTSEADLPARGDPPVPLDELAISMAGQDNADHLLIELRDWLEVAPLSERDRQLISSTMVGLDARSIARLRSIPLPRMRVQLSRAQARARAAWAMA